MSLPKKRRRVAGLKRGNNHHPAELTLAREERAWDLKARGFSTKEIREALVTEFRVSITIRAVNMALQRVAERTAAEAIKHAQAYKGRQIARLEAIAQEALTAYRRTVGEQVETVERVEHVPGAAAPDAPPGPPDTKRSTQTRRRVEAGDPRFLEKALDAMRDLRKLLGIDAPLKLDVARDRPLESLSDDELRRQIEADEAALRRDVKQ
jgi:hypothetical protein